MSIEAVARRRTAGRTIKATIPAGDMAKHGAGYPLTYRFSVPATAGLKAQWRTGEGAWQNLAPSPTGRFDGIDCARFSGGFAYVSKAFEPGTPTLHLRIADGSTAVGDFVTIEAGYDGRLPVAITYDDTPTIPQWEAATAAHQTLKLWMSPGLNCGPQHLTYRSFTLAAAAAGVAGGFAEVVNHTWDHLDANRQYATQAAADQDYALNDAALKEYVGLTPQSRGVIHSCIYPYGSYNIMAHRAAAKLGHLTGRLVIYPDDPIEKGTYARGLWDATLGMIPRQQASVNPRTGSAPRPGEVIAADESARTLAAVNYARANRLEQCIIYSYIRHWDWEPGKPWYDMLATIAAMPDVWSVGYGHMALYQRTRDRTRVEWA